MNTRVKFGSALSLQVGQFSVGVNSSLAEDDEQTRLMILATDRVRAALAQAGYAPR